MIIYNATIITWQIPNRIFENYGIKIMGDRITEIDKSELLLSKYPGEECIDAKGQLLMPGLICAHTHFYGLFSRGMALHGDAPADFVEILKKLWWPLDQSLLAEDIYYSALVSLIDAIKHGTTTVFDHSNIFGYPFFSFFDSTPICNLITKARPYSCFKNSFFNNIQRASDEIW